MQVPSSDPTTYCRLCFSPQHLKCVLSNGHPLVDRINEYLGLWLSTEEDLPCAVCRVCSTSLESFEAFRERSKDCDLALKKSRLELDLVEHVVDKVRIENYSTTREGPTENTVVPQYALNIDGTTLQYTILEDTEDNSQDNDSSRSLEPAEKKKIGCKTNIIAKRPKSGPIPRFLCQFCNMRFTTKWYLKKHQQRCQAMVQTNLSTSADLPTTSVQQKKGDPVVFIPISPKELRKEMNMYSTPTLVQKTSKHQIPSPQYKCDRCEARFYKLETYVNHRLHAHKLGQPLGSTPAQAAQNGNDA